MEKGRNRSGSEYVEAIRQSGLRTSHDIQHDRTELWIPTPVLRELLRGRVIGESVNGLSQRTRSHHIKNIVCEAMGYPIPSSYSNARPHFRGQRLHVNVQGTNNLQVWDQHVTAGGRYAVFRFGQDERIDRMMLIQGTELAKLDTTGTLARKFQADWESGDNPVEIYADQDTEQLHPLARGTGPVLATARPTSAPQARQLLPIGKLFELLQTLIGKTVPMTSPDRTGESQAALHQLVGECLGYNNFNGDDQFPSIQHQLLDVKLQRFATVEFGVICPNSHRIMDRPSASLGQIVRCRDVRLALFGGELRGSEFAITDFLLTTGEYLFGRCPMICNWEKPQRLSLRIPQHYFIQG